MQRDFWAQCAIGFIVDYRKFSVHHLQSIINSAWWIRGVVSVIGRDFFFYLIHFELPEDLNHFCSEGLWAVDGAFLVLENGRPNLVLSRLQLCLYVGSIAWVTSRVPVPRAGKTHGSNNGCLWTDWLGGLYPQKHKIHVSQSSNWSLDATLCRYHVAPWWWFSDLGAV